jgi:diguanylate cyclase (GGDEF)-like protein
MTGKSSNDEATGRRLKLLVGLAVASACLAGLAMVALGWFRPTPRPHPAALLILALAVGVAFHFRIRVRIQSSQQAMTWAEVPVLVGLAMLPGPWVVLCTFVGFLVQRLFVKSPLVRKVVSIAKETVSAAAAAAVFSFMGVEPNLSRPPVALLAAAVATVAIAVTEHLVLFPVMAAASGMSLRRLIAQDLGSRLIGYVTRYVAAILVMVILSVGDSMEMLLVLPFVLACVYLWQTSQIRTREERESWQRLAQATDELNAVDLTRVLHSAVSRSALIFSARETEIDLTTDGAERMVRGSEEDVTYDGPRPPARATRPDEVNIDLVTHDDLHLGALRLRFGGPVKLTDLEHFKLQTFASALCTAIRNAMAYAELARLNEQNAHAAAHDPLTGLANRRELYERADRYFQRSSEDGLAALLLIDLNHFKEVNDTLGHAAGDAVLRLVASRLGEAAAPGDLVARLGGDEFAVLMVNLLSPALATHRAERMLQALSATLEVDGMQITVDAAGGIALAPGSGGTNELMRRADIAMYQAKRAGQHTTTYAHAQDTADVNRLMLGGELQRAVDEHEFVVDFQPIVDLGSGEALSVEALARWHHPEHGYLAPMKFLETVERSGQLPAFADAVLDQALAAAGTWRDAGFDLPVAVNVSPRSLLDARFPATVLARLERHGTPADRLVLELAETLTISQLDVVGRVLAELREAGIRLALDDFGTGVSPLSVLSHIPVNQLKIDRSFVGSLETSAKAEAVVRSTVDLARNLQLTVIAEGVESEPQRHALWELGCVAGQGHLFARPMSSARLLVTLQRGSGGRPGALAAALHDDGAVVRMERRKSPGSSRALPHLPA